MNASQHVDTNTIKRRFLALNKDRLERINKSLRWRQRHFLRLLPLLFHINEASLPGFISKETPCGISNYKPTKKSIDAAKTLNKKFSHKKRALKSYGIYSLFLTGSSGTVAHTESSDFDIWLCHHPDLTDDEIEQLEEKANAISKWCEELELEVHFFLMDETRFKTEEHGLLDNEHSGTAQHHLLLEEFYRTGLLIAGRFPLWWLVPPDKETNYDEYALELLCTGRAREYEVIDFGGLAHIPAEEFFGASLWQIYKGIDSPYKSVLKILLMEAYANEYPNINLLCMNLKQQIYNNVTSPMQLDPYLMMCHKVCDYLTLRHEKTRLELARRCFYFKAGLHLSAKSTSDSDKWRKELLQELVDSWEWNDAHILMLDSRPTWKIHRVLEERTNLVNELSRSYKLLSSFARKYANVANIDQRDMTILGRKLYAAFERKSGKIEIINPDISPNLVEKILTFHEQDGLWLLFRGKVTPEEMYAYTPLKRAASIVELISWIHFNHLISNETTILLDTKTNSIDIREIKQILVTLNAHFPRGIVPAVEVEALRTSAKILTTVLFINIGIDPMRKHTNDDRRIISNRTNALSYSGFLDNLVLSIDQVSINSWQEIYTHTYSGIDEIFKCLCLNISMAHLQNNVVFPMINTYSFSSTLDSTVSLRVKEIFTDVIRYFHTAQSEVDPRFILGVENCFYQLMTDKSKPSSLHITYKALGTHNGLLSELALPRNNFSPIKFDSLTLSDHFIPALFENHQQGEVRIFIKPQGNIAEIYIVDELGSLFVHEQEFFSFQTTMSHYDMFYHSVEQRLSAKLLTEDTDTMITSIQFSNLVKKNNRWVIRELEYDPIITSATFLNVTVLIDIVDDNYSYLVYCDDKEFTTLEYGDTLFNYLAEHISAMRAQRADYPLYITDLELPDDIYQESSINVAQSIHYLKYKIQFENCLNEALNVVTTKLNGIN